MLANAIILDFVNVDTKFAKFSNDVFSIESAARRCGKIGVKPLKSAEDSIKEAIDAFAAFVKNEMAAQTSQLPSSTQNEIKLQCSRVAPTKIRSFTQNEKKLLNTLEDADRLLVLVEGAIARNLTEVVERTRIEFAVRRQLKDLLRCSQRAKANFKNAISPKKEGRSTHVR